MSDYRPFRSDPRARAYPVIDNSNIPDSVLFETQERMFEEQMALLEPDVLPVDQFTNYVWSFYAPDATLYPIDGFTYQQCRAVCNAVSLTEEYQGDTLDREKVREIVCYLYKLKVD